MRVEDVRLRGTDTKPKSTVLLRLLIYINTNCITRHFVGANRYDVYNHFNILSIPTTDMPEHQRYEWQ